MRDYQKRRILVYFGRNFSDAAPRNATAADLQKLVVQQRNDSYNVKQALISVGSGGLMGKGWRQGTQNALGYLPRAVAHNDFIFSVIAEESGFVGSVVVITLYAVVLFTGIRIAGQARDRLGKHMAVGVVTLLFSHVFIQHRHEHSVDARDGSATAATKLWRVFSALLVNRRGPLAKRPHSSKGLLVMNERSLAAVAAPNASALTAACRERINSIAPTGRIVPDRAAHEASRKKS